MKTYKQKNFRILLLLISFLSFFGCKKYEDGPFISFIPARYRVAGEWKLRDGGNATFKANGDYSYNNYIYKESGKWDFDGHREFITITISGSSYKAYYRIVELRENSMTLDDGSDKYYFTK